MLAAIIAAAWFPALLNGFIWDDDVFVTHNALLRTWGGLWRIWFDLGAFPQYYPLTLTSFWIQFQLGGLHPLPYHAANVLLHAANAFLLWQILRRAGVPGAWMAAALFAVHPVHVESVAWITERKNVLSGFFYLLSGYFCLRLLRLESGDAGEKSIPGEIDGVACHGFRE